MKTQVGITNVQYTYCINNIETFL